MSTSVCLSCGYSHLNVSVLVTALTLLQLFCNPGCVRPGYETYPWRGEEKSITRVKDCCMMQSSWDMPGHSTGIRYIAWLIDSQAKHFFTKPKHFQSVWEQWSKCWTVLCKYKILLFLQQRNPTKQHTLTKYIYFYIFLINFWVIFSGFYLWIFMIEMGVVKLILHVIFFCMLLQTVFACSECMTVQPQNKQKKPQIIIYSFRNVVLKITKWCITLITYFAAMWNTCDLFLSFWHKISQASCKRLFWHCTS